MAFPIEWNMTHGIILFHVIKAEIILLILMVAAITPFYYKDETNTMFSCDPSSQPIKDLEPMVTGGTKNRCEPK